MRNPASQESNENHKEKALEKNIWGKAWKSQKEGKVLAWKAEKTKAHKTKGESQNFRIIIDVDFDFVWESYQYPIKKMINMKINMASRKLYINK